MRETIYYQLPKGESKHKVRIIGYGENKMLLLSGQTESNRLYYVIPGVILEQGTTSREGVKTYKVRTLEGEEKASIENKLRIAMEGNKLERGVLNFW